MAGFADVASPASAELEAAWARLEGAWDEGGRHAAFVELARQLGALPVAARRYRAYAHAHPEDQAARLQLERVTKLVQIDMSTVVAARLPAAATPYKKTMVMLAIVVFLALSAWLYLAVLGKPPSGGRPTGGSGTLDELQQRADAQRKELMRQPTVPVAKPPPAVVPGPQSERR